MSRKSCKKLYLCNENNTESIQKKKIGEHSCLNNSKNVLEIEVKQPQVANSTSDILNKTTDSQNARQTDRQNQSVINECNDGRSNKLD